MKERIVSHDEFIRILENDNRKIDWELTAKANIKVVTEYHKKIKELEQENAELKADLKSLQYSMALQDSKAIDDASLLFSKKVLEQQKEIAQLQEQLSGYEILKESYKSLIGDYANLEKLNAELKEKWKDAKTFKIGDIQINKECE